MLYLILQQNYQFGNHFCI